jgi:hypothetical protein
MIDITLLATSAWTMIQPHLPALATSAATELAKKVPEAVKLVWEKIKSKFETKPAAKEALEDVIKTPDNPMAQEIFQLQLKKAMTEDESFAVDLSKLLEAAGDSYNATLTGDGAIAQGSGAVGIGKGAIYIGGNVGGNVTHGDNDPQPNEKNNQ